MQDNLRDFRILAPTGAFGNHLRWLLLLDDHFKLEVPMVPLGKISIGIAATFPKVWLSSLDAKLKFIKNHVYGQERTWNNWLITEWYYRDYLHGAIGFYHEFKLGPNSRCITMLTDPDLAYRSYFKFNSNLNNTLPKDFKKYIITDNECIQAYTQEDNVLTIHSSDLYNSVLDKNLYDSATQFFGLDDHYDVACEIHAMWYNLHQKSEKEFVQYVIDLYSKDKIE